MPTLRSARYHAMNNLLGKIIGSAELVLDRVHDAEARQELEEIVRLAEEGAAVLISAVGADY